MTDIKVILDIIDLIQSSDGVVRAVQRARDTVMPAGRARIISALSAGPHSQADLARETLMDSGQIANTIGKLVDAGLVIDRYANPARRGSLMELTSSGRIHAAKIARATQQGVIDGMLSMTRSKQKAFLLAAANVGTELDARFTTVPQPTYEDLQSGEISNLIELIANRNADAVAHEFNRNFEPYVVREIAAYCDQPSDPRTFTKTVKHGGRIFGAIVIVPVSPTAAQIKFLTVDFGYGIGGKGHARMLLQEAVDRLREDGCLYLHAKSLMQPDMISFYSRQGWEQQGVTKQTIFGRQVDIASWCHELQ